MAAISIQTVWEVRSTGSDTSCGGAFVAGATGTDWSQQPAAQFNGTDLHIDASVNTKVTSASHNFTGPDVGNFIRITAGTGWTQGFYQIVSVASNAATLNVTPSAAGNANNATWFEGGALATLTLALANMVAGNKVFIQGGVTYTTAAGYTGIANTAATRTQPYSRIIGYTTTRGDNGKATIQQTAGGLTATINCNNTNGWSIENLIIDCNGQTTSTGILIFNSSMVRSCKVMNFTTKGINLGGSSSNSICENCEVTGGTNVATGGIVGVGSIFGCWVHDNLCPGITQTNLGLTIAYNIVSNNWGNAAYDGVQISAIASHVFNNTIHHNGGSGIKNTSSTSSEQNSIIRNNLLTNNGAYGLNLSAGGGGLPADRNYDGNVYFNNTSGTRNNCDDTSTNPLNGGGSLYGQYTNVFDVVIPGTTLTPYIGLGVTDDYRLNNDPGAGAVCRGAGVCPFPGNTTMETQMDIGAAQAKRMLIDSGMSGGF